MVKTKETLVLQIEIILKYSLNFHFSMKIFVKRQEVFSFTKHEIVINYVNLK